MSSSIDIFYYAAVACFAPCIGIVAYLMATPDRATVSALGERGYKRQKARQNALFALFEPLLRLIATWLYPIPLGGLRKQIDRLLQLSGHVLGINADEFLAMCLLSGAMGAFLVSLILLTPFTLIAISCLTALLPFVVVSGIRDSRTVAVTRAMPTAIELMGLCISAGMDFPSSLREIVGSKSEEDDPLNTEFRQLLRDLDLGHSRKQALLSFRDRVSGEGISDFVAALIQSEEKGNPLREVLAAQAKVLRIRRSFRAEEMATAAGIKMVLPLALLMFMVLIIIIAPLILKMKEGGF